MRNGNRMASVVVVLGLAGAMWIAGASATGKAERTESGATLVIPADHASLGKAYYVLTGKDAQVTFASDAPLEHIKGTSSKVVGYAVVDNSGEAPAIKAGEFHLPIETIDTGIPMRDGHLQSERWMNAAEYPDVHFVIAETRDAKLEKETDEFRTYSMTLVGDMTVRDETREMKIPAMVTLMPASERTKFRAPGDLLAIRCDFEILLSEFKISDMAVGLKVAETIELETRLFLSTVSPDEMRKSR